MCWSVHGLLGTACQRRGSGQLGLAWPHDTISIKCQVRNLAQYTITTQPYSDKNSLNHCFMTSCGDRLHTDTINRSKKSNQGCITETQTRLQVQPGLAARNRRNEGLANVSTEGMPPISKPCRQPLHAVARLPRTLAPEPPRGIHTHIAILDKIQ